MMTASNYTYNALITAYYLALQNCVPNTNAASTTSFYNSTSDMGMFTTPSNSSTYQAY